MKASNRRRLVPAERLLDEVGDVGDGDRLHGADGAGKAATRHLRRPVERRLVGVPRQQRRVELGTGSGASSPRDVGQRPAQRDPGAAVGGQLGRVALDVVENGGRLVAETIDC